MVRWRESVATMAAPASTISSSSAARCLAPMVKRIAPDANVTSVVSMDDIDTLVKEIASMFDLIRNDRAGDRALHGGLGSAIADALCGAGRPTGTCRAQQWSRSSRLGVKSDQA